MTPLLIGIGGGIVLILLFILLKQFDKTLVYALVLSGIGFIYVGFTWTNLQDLIISSVQAIFFLMLAYFGTKRSIYILAAGYFLHGAWDIAYTFYSSSKLAPPQYDIFYLSIDFTIGFYILAIGFRNSKNKSVVYQP